MAAHASPTGPFSHHQQQQQQQQQYPPPPPPPATAAVRQHPNGSIPIHQPHQQPQKTSTQILTSMNEAVWIQIGNLSETMGDLDGATQAYEHAMNFNQWSVPAMMAISYILRSKDQFTAAVEYLRQILKVEQNNGEVWSSLGHCYLMMDDLQQAYSAYQQALYHLPDPKEPKLWYGIGILYDRYGSLEHAEEAFSQVMRMEPNFEKANEIYFRLGIIYKQQQKFQQSLECFRYIVTDPPRPLSEEDIWFQIGHVHEQQKDYDSAKAAYTRVLERDPNHAKVLQQLGWLHHQQSTSFASQEQAIEYLEKSVASDQTDAQSWYLLGRCYMSQQKYPKAYEAYQQAVYRDGRNPTFWCSIGVLYYQINQYRDALDAYSRAIRLNPNISEVWYDLGTLYESCNNQTTDALDAYSRAADLDPTNVHIKARLALLKGQPTTGLPNQGGAPLPQDVHPQAYQPGALGGPPGPQWGAHSQNPPPPGPAPPPLATANGWGPSRLSEVQNPSVQPPPLNPYESRDRQQPPPVQPPQTLPPRQLSPRQEPPRSFAEPQRPAPPSHRGLSPSPKNQHTTPAPYHQTPQHHPSQPPPLQTSILQQTPQQPPAPPQSRPTFGPPPPPPHQNNLGTPSHPAPMPPYQRQPSPQQAPDIRPLIGNPAPSPIMGGYPRTPYEGHSGGPMPPMATNIATPSSAHPVPDLAMRDREERLSSVPPKRMREWEDDTSIGAKKPASEETRSRLDEIKMHRPSPPQHVATPPNRSPSEMRRMDEQRPSSTYHPSEAAHHPPTLPSMQNITHQSPRMSAPPQEDHRAPPPPPAPKPPQTPPVYEPAARKMEMDENYDDSGDEEKRTASKHGSTRNSPKTNGTSAP
ncbi:TPR-like protein [Polychaeton citri CBS 116435]|uniref:TPR-like protein n=1 Tax=Polychaeton citri CBS 116435 TaxID=1314669 RepID=A0A9P4Q0R8_9PEZI|nr:TPR-like protein [Polychaeton citri CBS 116435]